MSVKSQPQTEDLGQKETKNNVIITTLPDASHLAPTKTSKTKQYAWSGWRLISECLRPERPHRQVEESQSENKVLYPQEVIISMQTMVQQIAAQCLHDATNPPNQYLFAKHLHTGITTLQVLHGLYPAGDVEILTRRPTRQMLHILLTQQAALEARLATLPLPQSSSTRRSTTSTNNNSPA
jgi:hypothetical protein